MKDITAALPYLVRFRTVRRPAARRARHAAKTKPAPEGAGRTEVRRSSESDSKCAQHFQALARRRVKSLRWATRSQARSVATEPSKSFARRLHLPNHAKVRSTTQRLGNSWKPLTPCGRWTISMVHGPQWETASRSCLPR